MVGARQYLDHPPLRPQAHEAGGQPNLQGELLSAQELEDLVSELCAEAESEAFEQVFAPGFSHDALLNLDCLMGGPGIATIHNANLSEHNLADRPIFRPLWYCRNYFLMFEIASWTTRSVVHMSGLHLESLLKRLGGEWTELLPLGRLIRESRILQVLGPSTAEQISRFTRYYNAAKHDIPIDDDRPLFTQREAVMAYVVSRKLAALLYPHVKLTLSLEQFEVS